MKLFYYLSLASACLIEIAGGFVCKNGDQYFALCGVTILTWVIVFSVVFWRHE